MNSFDFLLALNGADKVELCRAIELMYPDTRSSRVRPGGKKLGRTLLIAAVVASIFAALCVGAYALRCGMMLRRYAADEVFRRDYRRQVLAEYRRTVGGLLRYYRAERAVLPLAKELLFLLCPGIWRVYHRLWL